MLSRPYWDERLMIEEANLPNVPAIGDSWFWYPFNNLLNPIFNLFNGDRCVLAIGNNGAEVVEYVGSKYRGRIQSSLVQVASPKAGRAKNSVFFARSAGHSRRRALD